MAARKKKAEASDGGSVLDLAVPVPVPDWSVPSGTFANVPTN